MAELKMLRFLLGVTRMDKIRCRRDCLERGKTGVVWNVRRKDNGYIGRRMRRMELPKKDETRKA